jgi:hypothetical protein
MRQEQPDTWTAQILSKRVDLLTKHIDQLQEQIAHLQSVKSIAAERRAIYADMLEDRKSELGRERNPASPRP